METGNVLRHYPSSLWFNSLYPHKHETHKISIYYPFLCPPVARPPASCCISVNFKNLLLLHIFRYENISRELLVLIKWSQITELRLWEGLVLISERPWYEWLSQDLGITLSPYLSLSGRVQGMETIETISSPGYLDSNLPILQTTIAPSDWHTELRSETREAHDAWCNCPLPE